MAAARICGTEAQSLWFDRRVEGIAVEVIGQARSSVAMVELHDVVFQADAESDGATEVALFDFALTRRGGDPIGHFPDLPGVPSRPLGDLLFLPPRTRFHGCWQRGSQRTLWVVPDPDAGWLERDWAAAIRGDALDIRSGELRAAMLRLARELAQPGFASALMIDALCVEVLVLLQRHLGAEPQSAPEHALAPAQLRRIEQLVDCAGPVPTLAELARACGISERHFSRLFRLATGESAARFVHGRRMDRAQDRLVHSRLPVKQIAWEAGFESAAAFSAAFRRRTGQSPRAFRQIVLA